MQIAPESFVMQHVCCVEILREFRLGSFWPKVGFVLPNVASSRHSAIICLLQCEPDKACRRLEFCRPKIKRPAAARATGAIRHNRFANSRSAKHGQARFEKAGRF